MIIPKHEEIRVPALDLLTEMATLKLKEFEQPLADKMNLGEEEVAEEGEGERRAVWPQQQQAEEHPSVEDHAAQRE